MASLQAAQQLAAEYRHSSDRLSEELGTLRHSLEQLRPRPSVYSPFPTAELAPAAPGLAFLDRCERLEQALASRERELVLARSELESRFLREESRTAQATFLRRELASRGLAQHSESELSPSDVLSLVDALRTAHMREVHTLESRLTESAVLADSCRAAARGAEEEVTQLRARITRDEQGQQGLQRLCSSLGVADIADLEALALSVPRLESFVQATCANIYSADGLEFTGPHAATRSAAAVPLIICDWARQLRAGQALREGLLRELTRAGVHVPPSATDEDLVAALPLCATGTLPSDGAAAAIASHLQLLFDVQPSAAIPALNRLHSLLSEAGSFSHALRELLGLPSSAPLYTLLDVVRNLLHQGSARGYAATGRDSAGV